MPRSKAFDVEATLDKAKDQFWAAGYQATSMDDLLKAMGINRASFYDTYENKHKLLLDSLKRYIDHDLAMSIAEYTQGLGPRDAILEIFASRLKWLQTKKGRLGCFLVNTALEMSPNDKAVAEIVEQFYKGMVRNFASLIKQGQQVGTINPDIHPTQTGQLLLNHLLGLLVLLRSSGSTSLVKSVIKQVELLLG
jgi:TetR/AcrR family transcriptional repressor of nem operon